MYVLYVLNVTLQFRGACPLLEYFNFLVLYTSTTFCWQMLCFIIHYIYYFIIIIYYYYLLFNVDRRLLLTFNQLDSIMGRILSKER